MQNMVKITRIKEDGRGGTAVTTSSLDKLIDRMTKDDSRNTVGAFRDFVYMAQNHYGRGVRWSGDYHLMHHMPSFLPSLNIVRDKQGNETVRAFNGIVTLSVDHIDEETDLEAVKRVAAMMPMTLAAFIGSTGTTVKIMVRVEPKDGHAITSEEEAEQFYGLSYDIVVKMYDAVINHNVQMAASAREGNCLYAGFRMPLDPKPYFNPKASAIRIETVAQGKPLQVTQPLNDRQFTGEDGFMNESDSDIRQMLERSKQPRQIAGLGDNWTGSCFHIHAHSLAKNVGKRSLTKPRRAGEQHVVKRFATCLRSLDGEHQPVAYLALANKSGEIKRTQLVVKSRGSVQRLALPFALHCSAYLQTCRLIKPKRDIHILDGRARGSFAKIVKAGHEHQPLAVAANGNFHIVPAGKRGRREKTVFAGSGNVLDDPSRIAIAVALVHRFDSSPQLVGEKRNGNFHAAVMRHHDR